MGKRNMGLLRKFIGIVGVMLCCVCAFASDVSAVGYGDSISEAQADALGNLTSTIFGTNVFSGTLVTLDSQKDSSSFSQSVSTMVYGNLISVQYSTGEKTSGNDRKLGSYQVTATIPDSANVSYQTIIADSVISIKNIYAQEAESLEQKKAKLSNLLSALSEYNNARQVLISLGYATTVPDLGIAITFQSVYSEYESLLIEEENQLRNSSSSASTYATQMQIQLLLQQNEAEQKSLSLQKETALAQANAMNIASINEQIQQAIEQVSKTTGNVSDTDFMANVEVLSQAIAEYDAMCNLYNTLLSDEFERIDAEYAVNREALKKKAFKVAELKLDGTPTDSAMAVRTDELLELEQQRDQDKQKVESLVSSSLRSDIQDRYDHCCALLADIQTKSFLLDSRDERTLLTIGAYDGENFWWNCSIQSDFLCIRDIHVGYELLTGQEPVVYSSGKKNRDEYNKYVNDQAAYDAALRDNVRLFDLSVQYHLALDIETGFYGYVIDGIRFLNANAEIVMSDKDYSYTSPWLESPFVLRDYGYAWLKREESKPAVDVIDSTTGKYTYPLIPYESSYGKTYGNTVKYEDIATIPYAYTVGGFGGDLAGEWTLGLRADAGFGFSVAEFEDLEDLADLEASVAVEFIYYLSRFTYVGVSPSVSFRFAGGERSTTFHVMLDAGLYLEDIAALGLRLGIGKTIHASAYMRFLLPFITQMGFLPEFGITYENMPNSIRTYFGAVIEL